MSNDFETFWVEPTLPYKKISSLLVNVSYNPEETKIDIFLEELALQIDYGITKKQNFFLLVDFKLNYLNPNERNKMDTICVPYALSLVNKIPIKGKNLIDFVIKNDELPHSNVFICEPPIILDHKAIAMMTNVTIKPINKPPLSFIVKPIALPTKMTQISPIIRKMSILNSVC